MMQILYSSLHNLNMDLDDPIRKDIPEDFDSYMSSYIEFATAENNISRNYLVRDNNRTVMNCIADLLLDVIAQGDVVTDSDVPDQRANSIALKLLDTEKNAQEKVKGVSTIQKGSIIQALIKNAGDYCYVIAKVEHTEWIDGETFKKNFGFPGENKRVWKSAVLPLTIVNHEVSFGKVKCYVNTQAKYWTESFLEVEQAKDDKTNTVAVFKTIDKALKPLKKTSPSDFYNLKNSATHELQIEQDINYPDMVSRLLDNYQSNDDSVNVDGIKGELLSAMEQGRFDSQFHTDPKAIKRGKKISIPVSPTVDIVIKAAQDNWRDEFMSHETVDGKKYIMIRCEDDDTFRSFHRDDS